MAIDPVRRIETILRKDAAGQTLLDYLSRRFPYRTREEWRLRIVNGEMTHNGAVVEPECILGENDRLCYTPRDLVEPEAILQYRICFEDDAICVIDKPGNLAMHPAGPFFRHTLWYLLRERLDAIHFINRLDRETSGLLLAAKNSILAGRLSKELERMEKRYLVLVHGVFPEQFSAVGLLKPDTSSPIRKKQRFYPVASGQEKLASGDAAAKVVHTEFTRKQISPDGRFSLVECRLYTGKLHQIRCTLHTLGFPVVGDKLYGLDEQFYLKQRNEDFSEADRKRLLLEHQALHCCYLAFRHPITQEKMEFTSDLPAEIAALLE